MESTGKIQAMGLLLMAVFATASMAGEGRTAAPASTQNQQVTFRDPATGRTRAPTEAELAELSRIAAQEAAAQPSTGPLTEADARATMRKVRLSTGLEVTVMDVPQSLETSVVAERGADGKYHVHHAGDQTPAAAQEVSQ
ncbi:post-PEP-CTERM-1 domain-containing protein [Dyella sp. 2RAB6]|uniref:post-PEP-CTERM-1 domain-containing protein n=1 Tax=Dyella sp. 2RAB6 TaxID=3232992 RepID=UPI003F8DB6D0